MEHLTNACIRALDQLASAVEAMSPADFSRPSPALGGSTIGQHVRHTIEFFICLERGLATGVVNYDRRAHDKLIESHNALAFRAIQSIRRFVVSNVTNRPILLEVCYAHEEEESHEIQTTYFRELAYNLEHAIHHMAIIRIGMRDVMSYVALPDDFGIAASTVKHSLRPREAQAISSHHSE